MKLRRTTVVAALVTGSLALGYGTAHAEPAPAPAEPISYSLKLVDKTVVATLKNGTFSITEEEKAVEGQPIAGEIADDQQEKTKVAEIKDDKGNVVLSMPIDFFNVGDIAVPLESEVKEDNTVLELTPDQAAVPADTKVNAVNMALKPVASPIENQRAQNEFASQFGMATAVGGFLGTAIGVVAGALIGTAVGIIECLTIIGCIAAIPTIVAFAGIGGILGTIAVGGPALAIAGMDLINTLQAAPGTTKWTDENMKKGVN
ncbi:hypothetical protein B0T44_11940 [Nocardia donostiensis]|uniref:DUF8020 domain-containing protein n=1 Tax=Nocardia donostiensis TaxID=1538463 RepID=A0A1V2TJE8_9NOCA|nr:hypothetical protein B0T46_06265 [Nocardia donostiensis]OQS19948.1 hypothetical protein B0T44_11940 [Nocardia donostiensis]